MKETMDESEIIRRFTNSFTGTVPSRIKDRYIRHFHISTKQASVYVSANLAIVI